MQIIINYYKFFYRMHLRIKHTVNVMDFKIENSNFLQEINASYKKE